MIKIGVVKTLQIHDVIRKVVCSRNIRYRMIRTKVLFFRVCWLIHFTYRISNIRRPYSQHLKNSLIFAQPPYPSHVSIRLVSRFQKQTVPYLLEELSYYNLFKISISRIESMLTLFVCNKKLSDLTQSLKNIFEKVSWHLFENIF